MSFEHEGQLVTHPGLYRAFLRGVRFLDDEGVFVVQLGQFRGQIEVEDTPFWVVSYDVETGEIALTDGSSEQLAPDTLRPDPDGAFRCTVKGRFAARFTHAGQAHLLDALEETAEGWRLRAGRDHREIPGLQTA
jgi:hypothetical protein